VFIYDKHFGLQERSELTEVGRLYCAILAPRLPTKTSLERLARGQMLSLIWPIHRWRKKVL